ncbi:MAG TPA: hypothetical protein PKW64_03850 [Segatella copri]|jgi:hypothetical protein|nr:MAG TPA_asm: hypothetical protein [Caudoviricetes sp.]HRL63397.1 hypothetical protein [Segatella copri]
MHEFREHENSMQANRSERSEATARKHGFEIIEGEDDDSPDTSK